MKVPKIVKKAADETAAFFNAQVEFRPGKKTPFVLELRLDGQRRTVPVSLSNRDNQADWVRQDIRRMANDIRRCA